MQCSRCTNTRRFEYLIEYWLVVGDFSIIIVIEDFKPSLNVILRIDFILCDGKESITKFNPVDEGIYKEGRQLQSDESLSLLSNLCAASWWETIEQTMPGQHLMSKHDFPRIHQWFFSLNLPCCYSTVCYLDQHRRFWTLDPSLERTLKTRGWWRARSASGILREIRSPTRFSASASKVRSSEEATTFSTGDWLNHCFVSVSSDRTWSLISSVFLMASMNSTTRQKTIQLYSRQRLLPSALSFPSWSVSYSSMIFCARSIVSLAWRISNNSIDQSFHSLASSRIDVRFSYRRFLVLINVHLYSCRIDRITCECVVPCIGQW